MFHVPVDGTVSIAGQCVCDGSSEVTGVKNRLYVFKVSATLLANMANSVYQAADTTTLVCSVEWNNPSANQSITPASFESTNGIAVSRGDYLVVGYVQDGVVTATRYNRLTYQLYVG